MLLGIILGLAWIRAAASTLNTKVKCKAALTLKEVRSRVGGLGGGGGGGGGKGELVVRGV